MAEELVFLTNGENERGEAILEAFAERTGLASQAITGGVRFELGEDDHQVKVVETLTDIDSHWSRHLTLGEPGSIGN
jgi:hypothetical protein